MGYLVFNEGLENELVVNEFVVGTYLTGEAANWWEKCYWWRASETNIPICFDLSPLMMAFLEDPVNKNRVFLINYPSSTKYGVEFSTDGTTITTYFCTYTNNVKTNSTIIYQCAEREASLPTSDLFFAYQNDPATLNESGLFIFTRTQARSLTFSVGETQGRTGLIGTPGETKDMDKYITYATAPARPYDVDGSFCQDPALYSLVPAIAWRNAVFSIVTWQNADNLGMFTGTDNLSPEPYTPPAPEPPTPPIPDEPPFDPSEPDPYPVTPTHDDSSDEVPIPSMPTIGVSTAGFINVYNPGLNSLQGLGDILFPQFSTPTDIVDAVTQLYNVIANQNLINYVIDCHVIPVQPAQGGNKNIKVGYRDTGISVPSVAYDYVDATCGSLSLAEYFHGYADYAATKSKLYLPFVGFVDMKPEFWQAGTLAVDYKFNVIDGSFMCYVRSTSSKSQLAGSIIAQYSGNACMHLPLTGVNYSQMVSGIIGAGVAVATAGSVASAAGSALSAANTISRGGDVQQSNGYNSTAALMGVRKPFLMIERAVPAFPSKYGHDKGYPSNITTLLSNVKGYTEIEDIDLTGLPFTADELTELKQLLADGVYF